MQRARSRGRAIIAAGGDVSVLRLDGAVARPAAVSRGDAWAAEEAVVGW